MNTTILNLLLRGTVKSANDGYVGLNTQSYMPIGQRRAFDPEEQEANERSMNENWLGRLFESYGTPAHENLASPSKAAILGALLGVIPGAVGGAALGGNDHPQMGAGVGAAAGAGIGGLLGYVLRNQKNEGLLELMRRSPTHMPSMRDIQSDPVWQQDEERRRSRGNSYANAAGLAALMAR